MVSQNYPFNGYASMAICTAVSMRLGLGLLLWDIQCLVFVPSADKALQHSEKAPMKRSIISNVSSWN